MTDDLKSVVDELTGLLAKATPGKLQRGEQHEGKVGVGVLGDKWDRVATFARNWIVMLPGSGDANADLYIAARNHLPSLLSALAAAEKDRDAFGRMLEQHLVTGSRLYRVGPVKYDIQWLAAEGSFCVIGSGIVSEHETAREAISAALAASEAGAKAEGDGE